MGWGNQILGMIAGVIFGIVQWFDRLRKRIETWKKEGEEEVNK